MHHSALLDLLDTSVSRSTLFGLHRLVDDLMVVDSLLVAIRMQFLDHLNVMRTAVAIDEMVVVLVVTRMRGHNDRLHVRLEMVMLVLLLLLMDHVSGGWRLKAVAGTWTVLELEELAR